MKARVTRLTYTLVAVASLALTLGAGKRWF
jgi:hypothetical protein